MIKHLLIAALGIYAVFWLTNEVTTRQFTAFFLVILSLLWLCNKIRDIYSL